MPETRLKENSLNDRFCTTKNGPTQNKETKQMKTEPSTMETGAVLRKRVESCSNEKEDNLFS